MDKDYIIKLTNGDNMSISKEEYIEYKKNNPNPFLFVKSGKGNEMLIPKSNILFLIKIEGDKY